MSYEVKDSGQRQSFGSGMVRDVTTGKVDYSLVFDGPMLDRWAAHISKGAEKYSKRNWMQAEGDAELARFTESACRHFAQWMRGDRDEDHAAAVFFNLNGCEFVRERMATTTATGTPTATIAPETVEAVGQFGWTVPDDQKMGVRARG